MERQPVKPTCSACPLGNVLRTTFIDHREVYEASGDHQEGVHSEISFDWLCLASPSSDIAGGIEELTASVAVDIEGFFTLLDGLETADEVGYGLARFFGMATKCHFMQSERLMA